MPRRVRQIYIDDDFEARTFDELVRKLVARARKEWEYEAREHKWLKSRPAAPVPVINLNDPAIVEKWRHELFAELAQSTPLLR